jgi:integrase
MSRTLAEVLVDYARVRKFKPSGVAHYKTMLKRSGLAYHSPDAITADVLTQAEERLKAKAEAEGRAPNYADIAISVVELLLKFEKAPEAPKVPFVRWTPPTAAEAMTSASAYLVFPETKPDDQSPTLGEFFELYLNDHARLHTKSAPEFERTYRHYLQCWSDRKLSEIRRRHVVSLQAHVTKTRSPGVASRVVSLISMIFNKAIELEYLQGNNPAFRVRKFKHQPRERFLQSDELPRFFEAVSQLRNETTRDLFYMLLLTGQRRRNVSEMQWSEISFERKTWLIPQTKNGTSHTVPLVEEALAILLKRKENRLHPSWVFPKQDLTGPVWCRHTAWKAVMARAGLTDLRIHDLRRTLASWQACTGTSLPIIGAMLNHKDSKSTQIYARLNTAPVRESMEVAVKVMTDTVI